MLKTKKIVAAVAIALIATAGSVAPAEAGNGKPISTQQGGGWCC